VRNENAITRATSRSTDVGASSRTATARAATTPAPTRAMLGRVEQADDAVDTRSACSMFGGDRDPAGHDRVAVAALVSGSPCLAVGAPARLVSSGARMRLLVDAA
jgi:hypothetical protein